MTVRVRLTDGTGVHDPDKGQVHARIVPLLADHGLDPLVPNGAEIDVPDDVAGHEPNGWVTLDPENAPEHRELARAIRDDPTLLFHRYDPDEGLQVHDAGAGLLAQVGLWTRVEVKAGE